MDLQSLRDNSWSYKLRAGKFLTEFVIGRFVKQDEVIELVLTFAFGPLDFGLGPDLFTGSLSFLDNFPVSLFFLVILGQHSESQKAAATTTATLFYMSRQKLTLSCGFPDDEKLLISLTLKIYYFGNYLV